MHISSIVPILFFCCLANSIEILPHASSFEYRHDGKNLICNATGPCAPCDQVTGTSTDISPKELCEGDFVQPIECYLTTTNATNDTQTADKSAQAPLDSISASSEGTASLNANKPILLFKPCVPKRSAWQTERGFYIFEAFVSLLFFAGCYCMIQRKQQLASVHQEKIHRQTLKTSGGIPSHISKKMSDIV
eukprot:TRINITY_DN5367_c0_g1_i2.p1 TRINITY_DN5367_c0_g1~~TRINITY_DN5367_c0_g1_i2.p1  ORF type:complete len:191 (-),score=5.31 TRINITY_DN5367_c0_g1_i2:176-748(-)